MTVKHLINNEDFMDFRIGIYLNDKVIMIGLVEEIKHIATGVILNARIESYNVIMIGELHIHIKLQ